MRRDVVYSGHLEVPSVIGSDVGCIVQENLNSSRSLHGRIATARSGGDGSICLAIGFSLWDLPHRETAETHPVSAIFKERSMPPQRQQIASEAHRFERTRHLGGGLSSVWQMPQRKSEKRGRISLQAQGGPERRT